MHSVSIMRDIIMHNYSILCKRLLPISILSLLQVASLVICLKILNVSIIPTLASNIQASLTSHIWITCGRNLDNNLSVTMHIVTKDFKLQSFALELFPLTFHIVENLSLRCGCGCVQTRMASIIIIRHPISPPMELSIW